MASLVDQLENSGVRFVSSAAGGANGTHPSGCEVGSTSCVITQEKRAPRWKQRVAKMAPPALNVRLSSSTRGMYFRVVSWVVRMHRLLSIRLYLSGNNFSRLSSFPPLCETQSREIRVEMLRGNRPCQMRILRPFNLCSLSVRRVEGMLPELNNKKPSPAHRVF